MKSRSLQKIDEKKSVVVSSDYSYCRKMCSSSVVQLSLCCWGIMCGWMYGLLTVQSGRTHTPSLHQQPWLLVVAGAAVPIESSHSFIFDPPKKTFFLPMGSK